MERGGGARGGSGAGRDLQLSAALRLVPPALLAAPNGRALLLNAGLDAPSASLSGAVLMVDVHGLGLAARGLARDFEGAATQLGSVLGGLLERVVARLHRHGLDLLELHGGAALAFAPAAEGGESPAAAAGRALAAARDIARIEMQWMGQQLTPRQSIGVGSLAVHVLRSSEAEGPGQLLYAGDAHGQALEAQRLAWGGEIILSPEAADALGPAAATEALPAHGPLLRIMHRVKPWVGPAAPAPPASEGDGGAVCVCGSPLPARLTLWMAPPPSLDALLPLLRSFALKASSRLELARAVVVSVAFPEFGRQQGTGQGSEGGAGALPPGELKSAPEPPGPEQAARAKRLGQVFRAVQRVAGEFGGYVAPLASDDRSPVATLWFGIGRSGSPREQDPERAVRAAVSLQEWFESAGAPFAAGLAEGSVFWGAVGPACRRSFALVGDAVALAARLMESARERAERSGGQTALCAGGVVDAVNVHAGGAGRSRPSAVRFEEGEAIRVEGFEAAVPTFRAAPAASSPLASPGAQHPQQRPGGRTIPSSMSYVARGRAGSYRAAPAPIRPLSISVRSHAREFAISGCCGRDDELARVRRALAAFASDRRRGFTLVLEGEAGIGKSRLLAEVRRECRARDAVVLSAFADLEGSAPLAPLRRLLRALAGGADEASFAMGLVGRGVLTAAEAEALWSFPGPDESKGGAGGAPGSPGKGQQEGEGPSSVSPKAAPAGPPPSLGMYGSVVGAAHVHLSRVAAAFARLVAALEAGDVPAPAPAHASASSASSGARTPRRPRRLPRHVALLVEDADRLDSQTWFVLQTLRDECPSLALALTVRPMADPPPSLSLLAGRADPAPSPPPVAPASSSSSLGRLAPASAAGIESSWTPLATLKEESDSSPSPGPHPNSPGLGSLELPPPSSSSGPAPAKYDVLHLPLEPLERGAARELLAGLTSSLAIRWAPGVAEAVLEAAAGLPLYIVEVCRMAWCRGGVAPSALPRTVQEVVAAHLAQLPASAQSVARVASVVGAGFGVDAIRALDPSPDSTVAKVVAAFLQLRRAGIIREDAGAGAGGGEPEAPEGSGAEEERWPGAGATYSFSHALVKEAVYESLDEERRRDVHARYAHWLRARPGALPDAAPAPSGASVQSGSSWGAAGGAEGGAGEGASVSLLALHLCLAGDFGAAAHYLQIAAERALKSVAVSEARRTLAEIVVVIDVLELAGPASPPLPEELRAASLQLSGVRTFRALSAAASSSRPKPAHPSASASASASASSLEFESAEGRARWRATRLRALRSWAFLEYDFGRVEVATKIASVVLESLGEAVDWRPLTPFRKIGLVFRALRIVRALRRRVPPPAPPPTAASLAAASARAATARKLAESRESEPDARSSTDDGRRSVQSASPEPSSSSAGLLRPPPGGAGAPEEDEASIAVSALVLVAWCATKRLQGGRRDETLAAGVLSSFRAAELTAARRAAGLPMGLAHVRACCNFSTALYLAGLQGAAREALDAAADIGEHLTAGTVSSVNSRGSVLTMRGLQAALRGELAEASELFGRSLSIHADGGVHPLEATASSCILHLLLGRFGDAEELARRSLALMAKVGGRGFGAVAYQVACGFAALLTGRPHEAERHAAEGPAGPEGVDSWMQSSLQFVRGIARWQLRGDPAAVAEASRAFLDKWRNDTGSTNWLAILAVFCTVEYVQWAEAEAYARLGAPDGGGGGGGLSCGGRQRRVVNVNAAGADGAGEDPAEAYRRAAALGRETVRALQETRRKRLTFLAPFCTLAAGSLPGLPPARAARVLQEARAGFERAGMRPFAALAGLRLWRAELARGRAGPAEEARARAAAAAAEIGLRIPALDRLRAALEAGPRPQGQGPGPGPAGPAPRTFVSMWV